MTRICLALFVIFWLASASEILPVRIEDFDLNRRPQLGELVITGNDRFKRSDLTGMLLTQTRPGIVSGPSTRLSNPLNFAPISKVCGGFMKRGEGADWFSWWAQGDDVSSDHAGLTPEERELVKRYKGENYTLTASPSPEGPKYTVTNFMHGVSQEMKEITILLKNEEEIKSACRNFKTLLNVMATFGGEEVAEF